MVSASATGTVVRTQKTLVQGKNSFSKTLVRHAASDVGEASRKGAA
jgi:hypothetical protein